jgi:hypothetical protein
MEINASDFNLPSEFVMPMAHKAVTDKEGVSTFDYGNQGYVAWRFAYAARPWKPEKVRKYRIEGSDSVPVILFYRDKDNQIPIQLRRKMRYEDRMSRTGETFDKAIPCELSDLDKEEGKTELDLWDLPIGFENEMFAVAFKRFKQQGSKPGTPISAWRADPGQQNTLAAMGIFTVDQFGRMSEEQFKRMVSQLPPSSQGPLLELHDMAIAFVSSQSGLVDAKKFGDKITALEDNNERLKEELEEKDAEIQKLLAKIKGTGAPASRGRGRPPKSASTKRVEVQDGEILLSEED